MWALVKALVVTVSGSTIVIDKLLDTVCPALVTCTLKLLTAVVVGVPEITP
jgi:hypothetical protein